MGAVLVTLCAGGMRLCVVKSAVFRWMWMWWCGKKKTTMDIVRQARALT